MIRLNLAPPQKVNKESILENIHEYNVFQFYIDPEVPVHKAMSSPLRVDKNPSFCLYSDRKNGGEIKFMDFGLGEGGDFVNFVMKLYGLDYYQALDRINKDMILGIGESDRPRHIITSKPKLDPKKDTIITANKRPFTQYDIDYWKQFGISLSTLAHYDVYSTDRIWLNGKVLHETTPNSPAFVYQLNGRKKVYMPYNKCRFVSNITKDDMEGYNQLPWHDNKVILTKSMKDVMTLYELGYPAFTLLNEGVSLSYETSQSLAKRFKEVIVFYDNDNAGKKAAARIHRKYGYRTIFLEDHLPKDISDYVKYYGIKKATRFLKNSI